MKSFESSITTDVLRSYYPTVLTVQQYLAQILQPERFDASFLTHETDTIMYRALLIKAFVGSHQNPPNGKFKAIAPMVHLRDLIERAQRNILIMAKGRPSNVLTAGYQLNNQRGGSNTTLKNYFVNTIVTALNSSDWNTLFHRIGEDAMFHLLTQTHLFLPLPNGCLCQLTGEPIVHRRPPPLQYNTFLSEELHSRRAGLQSDLVSSRKRSVTEAGFNDRAAKRRKATASTSGATTGQIMDSTRRTPVDIPLVRARLFYFRPHYVPHTNLVVVGMPPNHVLNRISPSKHLRSESVKAAWIEPDSRERAKDARHLAKYVFPRQFGLSNPFVVEFVVFSVHRLPDYADREQQIKALGFVKTPKRVKPALNRLEQLIWHHGKCGYKPILERVCPSKMKNECDKPLDSSVILEMVSENSIQLQSQALILDPSISLGSSAVVHSGLSQLKKQVKQKPRFAEFACNHVEVYYYVVSVTKVVIPFAFWGSERNFKTICRHVKSFISARRYETLTLHQIVQGFFVSDCEWLVPKSQASTQQNRVSVTDSLKRLELLQEFLFWYFDSFLIPLLRTTFYVTESSAFRNKVLYFRQDDWIALCTPLIGRLTTDTFTKMSEGEAIELLRQRKLGFSFVRLLPKDTGVRPIVNLRRKKTNSKNAYGRAELSINQILQAAFQVLTYEKIAQKHLLGASVFGHNEVYTKLKAFKLRLESLSRDELLPKLYFVKVDVQACFDTITQGKLLSILQKLISEDVYMIERHGTVSVAASKIRRTYVKNARPDDDHPHFISVATALANTLRNTIFVDQVVYPYAHKKEILELLEEHITENIVKIGNNYYRQSVGIPQGSVLSTILCSFFYGDLERNELKFTQDHQSVLLRLVDDYLLVTTSEARAKKFLDVMVRGHPEYGCFISREKILTNLDLEDLTNTTAPNQSVFPWCGYLINMKDLSVSVDYSRFHSTYLSDALTVDSGRRAANGFRHKMLQLVKSRSHIIYTDAHLNSGHTIHLNIYQNFMSVAMKMHYHLRSWKLDVAKSSGFIKSTIRQIIIYAHASMKNKSEYKVAKASGAEFGVHKGHVLWLGTHAFLTVLSRKAHVYPHLLKALEFDMSLPQYRRFRRRFRAVTKEGLEMFTMLTF